MLRKDKCTINDPSDITVSDGLLTLFEEACLAGFRFTQAPSNCVITIVCNEDTDDPQITVVDTCK